MLTIPVTVRWYLLVFTVGFVVAAAVEGIFRW